MPDVLPAMFSVFGIAFFSYWASFPAGVALNLPLPLVALSAWVSYVSGAVIVVLLGAPLREKLLERFGGKNSANPNSLIRRAWDRFGLIGLGFLAPMVTGSQMGAIVGLSFGARPVPLILALALGGLLWAVLIAGALALGVSALHL